MVGALLYIIYFFILGGILYFLYKRETTKSLPFYLLLSGFTLRIFAGFMMYVVYTQFYVGQERHQSDIFKFFDDGIILYSALEQNPEDFFSMLSGLNKSPELSAKYYDKMMSWHGGFEKETFNDAKTMVRINAFVRLFSAGNFHIHQLISAFLSFLGLWSIFLFFQPYILHKKTAATTLFLCPSLLLWGSPIFKESFALFLMGAIFWTFKKFTQHYHIKWLVCIMCLFLGGYFLKVYVFLILFVVLFTYLISSTYAIKASYCFSGLGVFCILFFFLSDYFGSDYSLPWIITWKQKDFFGMLGLQSAGSILPLHKLDYSYLSFLYVLPDALYNVLYHKHIWQARHFLECFSILEQQALLLFTFLVFYFGKVTRVTHVLFSLTYLVLLFLLIGYTVPVLGAIVRYKIPGLVFWILALFTVKWPLPTWMQTLSHTLRAPHKP